MPLVGPVKAAIGPIASRSSMDLITYSATVLCLHPLCACVVVYTCARRQGQCPVPCLTLSPLSSLSCMCMWKSEDNLSAGPYLSPCFDRVSLFLLSPTGVLIVFYRLQMHTAFAGVLGI